MTMKHDVLEFGRPFEQASAAFTPAELRLFADLLSQLNALYAGRLLAVKLVGSRARGTAMDRSDYDFLIFLDRCDPNIEVPQLEQVAYELTLKHGLGAVSLSPLSRKQFGGLDARRPGITDNFRREAVNLWP